jgi:hypothetical protein
MKGDSDKNREKEIKRKCPRDEIIVDVIYKVLSPMKSVGLTRNIGRDGLCLLLDDELRPGTILELKYRLPHEESKQIVNTVEVVWQKKTEKGFLTGVKTY